MFLLDWVQSPPQTNEVRRSAGLIASAHWLDARFRLPLHLSELGASVDLNPLRADVAANQRHRIYHTIAWQYFPPATQTLGRALIEAAGAVARSDAPLAGLSMKADADPNGAALVLRLWPGDRTVALGRAGFHGQWVDWTVG